ncbi:hypothetical protein EBU24_03625 [bacterium]|nr:hypothetical protein [bacterium]
MLNIRVHNRTKIYTCYLAALLSLFSISSLSALYMLDVHIENVQDVHVSAVIVAIKKLLPNYKIAVAVNTQASLTSTATSFFSASKNVIGSSLFSYCSIAFIIYRVYSVVKTIASFVPSMTAQQDKCLYGDPLSRDVNNDASYVVSFTDRLLFKTYYQLITMLNALHIRRFLPYDEVLEKHALFIYDKIFADE